MRADSATDCMTVDCPGALTSCFPSTERSASCTDAFGTVIRAAGTQPLLRRARISGRPSLPTMLHATSEIAGNSVNRAGESRSSGNAPFAGKTSRPQPRRSRIGLPVTPLRSPRIPHQRANPSDSGPSAKVKPEKTKSSEQSDRLQVGLSSLGRCRTQPDYPPAIDCS